jgi:hypothetical protein
VLFPTPPGEILWCFLSQSTAGSDHSSWRPRFPGGGVVVVLGDGWTTAAQREETAVECSASPPPLSNYRITTPRCLLVRTLAAVAERRQNWRGKRRLTRKAEAPPLHWVGLRVSSEEQCCSCGGLAVERARWRKNIFDRGKKIVNWSRPHLHGAYLSWLWPWILWFSYQHMKSPPPLPPLERCVSARTPRTPSTSATTTAGPASNARIYACKCSRTPPISLPRILMAESVAFLCSWILSTGDLGIWWRIVRTISFLVFLLCHSTRSESYSWF